VILENQILAALPRAAGLSSGAIKPLPPAVRARIADPLAQAFTNTFWWAVALTAVAIVPAAVLAVTVRHGRASGQQPAEATQAAA